MPCSANRPRAASMMRVWAAVYAEEPRGLAPARLARMAVRDRSLARIAGTCTGRERNTPTSAPEPERTSSAPEPMRGTIDGRVADRLPSSGARQRRDHPMAEKSDGGFDEFLAIRKPGAHLEEDTVA